MKNKLIKQGRIVSIRGKDIHILYEEKIIICCIKNSLKKEKTNQKNLIAIGDLVLFNENKQIVEIQKRSTFLERMDPLNPRKKHILGANIDQVFITFAIKSPDIDIPMIDRYIISAQKGGLKPIVVINKIDLAKNLSTIQDIKELYAAIDIPVIAISTLTKEGINELNSYLNKNISIFSGPSGVGKTSLINLLTGKNLEVGLISEKIQKGKHTTTFSSLLQLRKNTFIIDTPGIASFSIYKNTKEDILDYFLDLTAPLGQCKFRSCTHTHEPSCMVKEAEKQNLLSPIRLASFQNLMHEIN